MTGLSCVDIWGLPRSVRRARKLLLHRRRRLGGVAHRVLLDARPLTVAAVEDALGHVDEAVDLEALGARVVPEAEAGHEPGDQRLPDEHAAAADVAARSQAGADARFRVVADHRAHRTAPGLDLVRPDLHADLAVGRLDVGGGRAGAEVRP